MKNSITLLFICLFAFAGRNIVNAQNDSLSYLKVDGIIANAGQDRNGCKVELWSSKGMVDSIMLNRGKTKFRFMLPCNSYFTVRITKNGFVDRLICIDTSIPKDLMDEDFSFRFETELIAKEDSKSLNQDALDFPATIVHYHSKEEYFDYNKQYTDNIRQELYANAEGSTAKK